MGATVPYSAVKPLPPKNRMSNNNDKENIDEKRDNIIIPGNFLGIENMIEFGLITMNITSALWRLGLLFN